DAGPLRPRPATARPRGLPVCTSWGWSSPLSGGSPSPRSGVRTPSSTPLVGPPRRSSWFWAASIALVDLLPVPASGNLQFSLTFPLQLAVALLYPPMVAAAVTLVGSSDNRELKGELPPLQALFIRAQVAVPVCAAGAVFR